jgi:putative tryptophan/tyrosine transport system substrate-binding protein
MNHKPGHVRAGLLRRVRTDTTCRSTRRAFLLAAAAWPALAWADAALAQSNQPILIGWLNMGSRELNEHLLAAFKEGLAAFGWKVGSQIVLEERWANGRIDRLQPLAEELAAKKPAVIVAASGPTIRAAVIAAPKTPVVMATGGNPVVGGLAASLARPGGMVTGVTSIGAELGEKNLELLLAAAPKLRRVGFLWDRTIMNPGLAKEAARRSVAQHAVEARFAEAARPEEIEAAISRLEKEGAQALIVLVSQAFLVERRRIIKLALTRRWPVVAGQREWADEGALLTYGVDSSTNYRRAAYYVDRILKGAKPGDLPIEQPTKFELVVNLKTAKTLGLVMPQTLLLRADQVIDP